MTRTTNPSKFLFPLLFCTTFFCVNATFAENKKVKKGSTILYKGNIFQLGASTPDTIYFENPKTGKQEMKVSILDSIPISINGEKILTDKEIDAAPFGEETIMGLITKSINNNPSTFNQLEDGDYSILINQVVIGRNGKVLYYKFDGIKNTAAKGNAKPISKNVQARIGKLIDDLMASDELLFESANKGGVRVTSISNSMNTYIRIRVKKGIPSIIP